MDEPTPAASDLEPPAIVSGDLPTLTRPAKPPLRPDAPTWEKGIRKKLSGLTWQNVETAEAIRLRRETVLRPECFV